MIDVVAYELRGAFSAKTPMPTMGADERKCRFCGKGIAEGATFNHVAHAISECLGNKHIFTPYECDKCNQEYSKLEQHIGNFLGVLLNMYEIEGKPSKKNPTGLRKIKTPDLAVSKQGGTTILTVKDADMAELQAHGRMAITSQLKFDKYIPLNVYKSFCKYAISLFREDDFEKFSKLTKWINGECELCFEPIVLFALCKRLMKHPCFIYFTQQNDPLYPFCVGLFLVGGLVFAIEFPSDTTFEDLDNAKRMEVLRNLCSTYFPKISFYQQNLSGNQLVASRMSWRLIVPPHLRKGVDYFVGGTKEEVDELIKKYVAHT